MRRTIRVAMIAGMLSGGLAVCVPALASAKTVCATGCFFKSIQAAINAAQPGATITVGAGSYYENVVVNKPLMLKGSGAETVIYPAVSKPTCGKEEGSLCGGTASNIILVEADNVTISALSLRGDNPKLTSKVVVGGEDIDARNGIITNHAAGKFNGLTVSKVKVTGVYLRGIYASSEGTFDLNHDTVENVQGEEASIAIFNFGGSGSMANNTVANANDAISANWSRGTKFVNNLISKSGSGVHTDNNGGFGGIADEIKGNTVRECHIDGYGIFVFVPYLSATVQANKVKGCAVALAAFGGAVSGEGPTFASNQLNGTGATTTNNAGTYGAYLTTDQLGFAFGDLTTTLTGNSFTHFNTGLFVTQTSPSPSQLAGGQATVTASPNNSFTANGVGANGDTGTVVNAKSDWWGCPQGPNAGGACNTAAGTVDATPYLPAKP